MTVPAILNPSALILPENLNFTVEKAPLFDSTQKQVATGTFRSDSGRFLGVVSDRYKIIQNDTLLSLPSALGTVIKINDADIKGETFDGGKMVSLRVKLPFHIDVLKKGDVSDMFLRIFARHDGTGAVASQVEALRLVCTNGLKVSQASRVSSIRHTSGAAPMIEQVRKELKEIKNHVDVFQATADYLAKTQMNTDLVGAAIMDFYDDGIDNNIYTNEKKQTQARRVLDFFESNDRRAFPDFCGTAWALFNSFTRFATHDMTVRDTAEEGENAARAKSLYFGRGAEFAARAFASIKKVLTGNGHNF